MNVVLLRNGFLSRDMDGWTKKRDSILEEQRARAQAGSGDDYDVVGKQRDNLAWP